MANINTGPSTHSLAISHNYTPQTRNKSMSEYRCRFSGKTELFSSRFYNQSTGQAVKPFAIRRNDLLQCNIIPLTTPIINLIILPICSD